MASEYRLTLAPHTLDTQDAAARTLLERAKSQLGFVPNMYATMVNSPGLLEAYMLGYDRFRSDSGFTPAEQEVVFLTISRFNGCEYCVAAHSLIADQMSKVPLAVTEAIRDGHRLPDARLSALSTFTATLVASRGLPSAQDVRQFLTAGFTERQILEIILAIAVKTLSNYSNHMFHTALDPLFASRAWAVPA